MRVLYFFCVLNVVSSYIFPNLLPFYYKIGEVDELKDEPKKIIIDDEKLCLFKDQKTGVIKLISDKCPHRSASLSKKGVLDSNGGIVCMYHGICFHKHYNTGLTSNLRIINNDIFFCPTKIPADDVFYPPEEFDKNFRIISGKVKLNTNINIFLENVLDSQHVYYVHLFGKDAGNVSNLEHKRLSNTHYRQTYDITTGPYSLSNQIQKMKKEKPLLNIQNEYSMPSNVLSRVKIDKNSTKTVFVRAYPISNNETMIYWYIYRDFMVYEAELFNLIGDWIFRVLFLYTLSEDIGILNHVYNVDELEKSKQIHIKYDKIQIEYRRDCKKFINLKNLDN